MGLEDGRLRAIRRALLGWAKGALRPFPWRKDRPSAYETLLAEVLLQRTTAKAVSRVYPAVLRRYPTVRDLARADRRKLESLLDPLGIYRVRSRQLLDLARQVDAESGGELPKDPEGLASLPGVGRYIASAIRSQAHGIRIPMVDSNVERVWGRVFERYLARANRGQIVAIARRMLPRRDHREFNLALIDLGSTICLPRVPKCGLCPLAPHCDYGAAIQGRNPLPETA